MVLTVASLGWVFDAFEGQIFNIMRGEMLPDLLRTAAPGGRQRYRQGDRESRTWFEKQERKKTSV